MRKNLLYMLAPTAALGILFLVWIIAINIVPNPMFFNPLARSSDSFRRGHVYPVTNDASGNIVLADPLRNLLLVVVTKNTLDPRSGFRIAYGVNESVIEYGGKKVVVGASHGDCVVVILNSGDMNIFPIDDSAYQIYEMCRGREIVDILPRVVDAVNVSSQSSLRQFLSSE